MSEADAQTLSRRELLRGAWLKRSARGARIGSLVPPPEPAYLRPPGALHESAFLAACDACGDCIEACPHDVLVPLDPATGNAAGTPTLYPRTRACQLCEGMPCIPACTRGALLPIPRHLVRIGIAVLDPSLCWSVRGQPCDYCVTACPVGPTALSFEGDRPRVHPEQCTGCGQCVFICTATPPALMVEPDATPAQAPSR